MNELVELKIYGPLNVNLIERTIEQSDQKDGCSVISLESVGRQNIAAYTKLVLSAIQKIQPQEDIKNAFSQSPEWFKEISEKIISVRYTVEQVGGHLYGVFGFKSWGTLSPLESARLKRRCYDRLDSEHYAGFTRCPGPKPETELSIHYWQDSGGRLLTKAELDDAIKNGRITNRPIVTEINKDTFWSLIETAKQLWSQDLGGTAYWLVNQLLLMEPEQARRFDDIFHAYKELSHKYGLWTAASIIWEDFASEDRFADFRGWLIAQGKDVYLTALKDPDSLADVSTYGDCIFGPLARVGAEAYETLTGRSPCGDFDRKAHQALGDELKKDIKYGEGVGYPYTHMEIPAYLPKLCRKYYPEEVIRSGKLSAVSWNPNHPDIKAARKSERKGKKIRKNRGGVR